MSLIIFDLDGTLADNDHRAHHLEQHPKDWEAWHAECVHDTPNEAVCLIYRALKLLGEEIEIWTSRDDRVKQETEGWLTTHLWSGYSQEEDIYDITCPLRMRQQGNYIEDTALKGNWLATLPEPPKLVFEDRLRMVDWWREQGVTCLHVGGGDF